MDDVTRALERAAYAADDYYSGCFCDGCSGCSGMVRAAVLAFLKAMPDGTPDGHPMPFWHCSELAAAIEEAQG